MEKIEYIIACSCGQGIRLGLSERERRDRDLNKSTQMLINLFRVFHEEHGAVAGWFSDKPAPRFKVENEREL